jgi:uncharacterized protein
MVVGELHSHPAQREIGPAPHGFPTRSFLSYTPSGQAVAGWLATGRPGKGAVLLLHGVRADRTQMLARARFLNPRSCGAWKGPGMWTCSVRARCV